MRRSSNIWRATDSDNVQSIWFQYAPTSKSACQECKGKIITRDLRAKLEFGNGFYCFDCLWKYETPAKCKKSQLFLATERVNALSYRSLPPHIHEKGKCHYISLESLDTLSIMCAISPEDVERIREHVALAQEGKTPYYTPDIVKKQGHGCAYCNAVEDGLEPAEDYDVLGLRYDKAFYHYKCLSASGIINIDAKEIRGYDEIDDAEKELLDELFVKDTESGPIFMAIKKLGFEHCALKNCSYKVISKGKRKSTTFQPQRAIQKDELRIRYGHLSYHPKCFASLGKVNVDAEDIPNYDEMKEDDQEILRKWFKKSKTFEKPVIEKIDESLYCAECCTSKASKFPYPYTIFKKKDQVSLQIRFQGDVYHPECLQKSGKIVIPANEMEDFDSLTFEEKQTLIELFKKTRKRKSTDDQSNAGTKKKKSIDGNEGIKRKIKQEFSCFSSLEGNVQRSQSTVSEESEENELIVPTRSIAFKEEDFEVVHVVEAAVHFPPFDLSGHGSQLEFLNADANNNSQEVIVID
uniref:Uncharacterized protein n=1 Tax=Panagrolaimus davidi TaxID=227884 RepID=A0A914QD20_9BILA